MSITVSKEEVIGFEKLKAISQIAPIEKQKRLHQTFLQAKTFTKKNAYASFLQAKTFTKKHFSFSQKETCAKEIK
jgi:hypothetical protein